MASKVLWILVETQELIAMSTVLYNKKYFLLVL